MTLSFHCIGIRIWERVLCYANYVVIKLHSNITQCLIGISTEFYVVVVIAKSFPNIISNQKEEALLKNRIKSLSLLHNYI